MDREVEDWSVKDLYKARARIAFPEYQREKLLWSNDKKCLLIDSIFNDIDIPKLYFNELKDRSFEVIDGQQRLWSIWQFLDNEYRCKIDGRSSYFSDLTGAQQKQIENYKFQVTVFKDVEDSYLRRLFVRLQLGLLLVTGEKLNAATGKMKNFVFTKMALHEFVKGVGIPVRRFAKQTLAAQIAINSFSQAKLGLFARTRYDDLEHFFIEYQDPRGKDLALFNEQTKKIMGVLDELWLCFGDQSDNLRNRSYIVSVYLLLENIGPLSTKDRRRYAQFISALWKRLREEISLGMERKNREIYLFESYLSSAPGEQYQIQRRHDKLKEFYEHYQSTRKILGDK